MKWTLELIFKCEDGRSYHQAMQVGSDIANEISRIEPLNPVAMFPEITFDRAVKILKTKQFRKDLFIHEATRLGGKLAEYMEDKEGWHGADRQEAYERLEGKKL